MNNGLTAVITGASKGIGAAVARELAPSCSKLLLHGRDANALDALASEIHTLTECKVAYFLQDTRKPEASERVSAWVSANSDKVDVLFLNAGYYKEGSFFTMPLDDMRRNLEGMYFFINTLPSACTIT